MTYCTGTTANGQTCQRPATPGFPTCAQHRAQHDHARQIIAGDLPHVQGHGQARTVEARASRLQSISQQIEFVPPPSIQTDDAQQLLSRMLRDGLVTRTRDGRYHLRSYGRDALTALQTITKEG